MERLFLIVNPIAEVKYDAEKEQKMSLATKNAQLIRVEVAKKQEEQKGKVDSSADVPISSALNELLFIIRSAFNSHPTHEFIRQGNCLTNDY